MKAIYKALADFQQECPVIHKDTDGYGYTYADLPQILETVNPLLKKHGLGFTQLANKNQLDTIVFHVESGEAISSSTDIPQDVKLSNMNTFQVLGSAISYIRRYALSSILGIVTDKDTDAAPPKKQAPANTPQTAPSGPELAWLNQYEDKGKTKQTKEFLRAVAAITVGVEDKATGKVVVRDIDYIKQHYRVSNEVKSALEAAKKSYQP